MQLKDHFQDFVCDPERRRIYEREALAFEASESISNLMEQHEVSKSKLAELVGTSKSHVTQLLSGSRNMTMHTLADLAFVLGYKVEIHCTPLATANCSQPDRSQGFLGRDNDDQSGSADNAVTTERVA
jgi:transcriptional regulator with XRE-family HTH domain